MSTERRLFVPALPESGGELALGPEAARHVHVLRLALGDPVTLFDGSGRRAAAVLVALEPGRASVRAEAPSAPLAAGELAPITLVQCLPRGGKLDDLVRSATELGVDSIRLATSAHAVSRADGDGDRWERRHERLLRVVREAARQSERDAMPTVEAPEPVLVQAAKAPPGAARLVLCGRTGEALGRLDPGVDAWLVIGPEGGLSAGELEALGRLGYRAVTLGNTILRVETAVVAAISAVKQALGTPAA